MQQDRITGKRNTRQRSLTPRSRSSARIKQPKTLTQTQQPSKPATMASLSLQLTPDEKHTQAILSPSKIADDQVMSHGVNGVDGIDQLTNSQPDDLSIHRGPLKTVRPTRILLRPLNPHLMTNAPCLSHNPAMMPKTDPPLPPKLTRDGAHTGGLGS